MFNKSDLREKAFALADLLDYQKNAVVSRETIKKEAGTVTLSLCQPTNLIH